MEAAAIGHASVAATLVLLGANLNESDTRGRMAMMHAAENGRVSVVRALRHVETAANSLGESMLIRQASRQ